MCGIAGFTGSQNDKLLRAMTDALAYRGPDADGFFSNGNVNFGHRRLSIIDLASGAQPMFDDQKNVSVIFNGEIYNFKEIKNSLSAKYQFKTSSDTEVIIYAYKEYGEEFVKKLNGMFAIALWDERQKKLLLIRDRMGQKPLYYRTENNQIYFASEPKSLLVDGMKKDINQEALHQYFLNQYIPGDLSIFEGVKKVLPGHYIVWQNGKVEDRAYWQLEFNDSSSDDPSVIAELLEDAVKLRLIADVPLGVFLSGGIDSTAIAHFAQKHTSQKINTFSIGFDDPSFDESEFAKKAAEHIGSDHHHQQFTSKDVLDLIPQVFSKLDEPMADASILPTYLLSAFTRKEVTVALGGDGGDELFAGYPTFQAHTLANRLGWLPWSLIANRLPVSHDNFSFDFKLKRFARGAHLRGAARDVAWTSAFDTSEQNKLFNKDIKLPEVSGDSMNDVLAYWQHGYLVDDILTKADRASMYNSLELRAPFLDYRLVQHVNNLSYDAKVRGNITKYALKQALRGAIPDEIIDRKKKGFGVPLAKWLSDDLKPLLLELTSTDSLKRIGLFNEVYVQQLVSEHIKKQKDHRIKLWTLLTFIQWHNNYLK